MIKQSTGERVFDFFLIVLMLFMVIVTIYPLMYVLFASLSRPTEYMAHSGLLLKPYGLTFGSYREVFKNPNITRGYLNTLFVVSVGTLVNLVMTSIGAYFLSRKNLMWRNIIMFMAVFTMFFSGGLIPFYLTVKQLKIDDTLWALIFPVAINTYNMIILRTAFLNVPEEIEESAKLDGAGPFRILFYIMIPIAAPTIAVITLYYAVHHWNAWFHAMIFLRTRELYPLQLILREILILNDTTSMTISAVTGEHELLAETIKYAVVIVATVPVLVIYPFLQRYFTKGIMVGALKG
ncbi:MAG: carbohydrate ABC transporter permease [Firmicutes bacterium]|nr:carbohydrate ABC transporter permease [Bacillota bacterium]